MRQGDSHMPTPILTPRVDGRSGPPNGKPVVSVVMAVLDGERFLEKAVRSILTQTLQNIELIVVDDGSSDRTPEVLDRFHDARMRVVTQRRQGLAAALNRGIGLARAGLVARMDADDVAMPERLEHQVSRMDCDKELGVLGTAVTVINESGTTLRQWLPATDPLEIKRRLIRANQFAHPTVMFRKEAFEQAGGYRDMPFSQDYDLWLRMSGSWKMANLPEATVMRRELKSQFGSRRETQQIRWAVRARLGSLRRGEYPPQNVVYLFKPALAAAVPGPVRQAARKLRRAA